MLCSRLNFPKKVDHCKHNNVLKCKLPAAMLYSVTLAPQSVLLGGLQCCRKNYCTYLVMWIICVPTRPLNDDNAVILSNTCNTMG